MSEEAIERSRAEAIRARRRFEASLAVAQRRLRPQNLAGEAWDGVKDRSADLAEGALQAAKRRPAAVATALGALAIFLARAPLKRAVGRLVAGDEDDGIEPEQAELSETAEAAARVKEGAS